MQVQPVQAFRTPTPTLLAPNPETRHRITLMQGFLPPPRELLSIGLAMRAHPAPLKYTGVAILQGLSRYSVANDEPESALTD
jgi:hypothetical protein